MRRASAEKSVKRMHVGGLAHGVDATSLNALFGKLPGIEVRGVEVARARGFAYVDVLATEHSLRAACTILTGTQWKGGVLRVGEARPDFRARLQAEWEEAERGSAGSLDRAQHDRDLAAEHEADMRECDFGGDVPMYLSIRERKKGRKRRVVVAVGGRVDREKRRRIVEQAVQGVVPKSLRELQCEYIGALPIGSLLIEAAYGGIARSGARAHATAKFPPPAAIGAIAAAAAPSPALAAAPHAEWPKSGAESDAESGSEGYVPLFSLTPSSVSNSELPLAELSSAASACNVGLGLGGGDGGEGGEGEGGEYSDSESVSDFSDGPPPLSIEAWSAVDGGGAQRVRVVDSAETALRVSALKENTRMQALLDGMRSSDDVLRLRGGGSDESEDSTDSSDSDTSWSSDSSAAPAGTSAAATRSSAVSAESSAAVETSAAASERTAPAAAPRDALSTGARAASALFLEWKQPRRFDPRGGDAANERLGTLLPPKPVERTAKRARSAVGEHAADTAAARAAPEASVPPAVSAKHAPPPPPLSASLAVPVAPPKIEKSEAFSSIWAEEGERKLAGAKFGSFSFGFSAAAPVAAAAAARAVVDDASAGREAVPATNLLSVHAATLNAAEDLLLRGLGDEENGGKEGSAAPAAHVAHARRVRDTEPVDFSAQAAAAGWEGCSSVVKLTAAARDRGVGARFMRTLTDAALEEQWLASRSSLTAEFKYRHKSGKRERKKTFNRPSSNSK